MSHVEQPASVVPSTFAHDGDGVIDTRVGPDAGGAQVIEPTQHVIMPQRRKSEPRPRRVDDVAG